MRSLNVLIGMTGSVGVLSMPPYLYCLKEQFPSLRVILTHSAANFIPRETLSLVVQKVYGDLFPPSASEGHTQLASWADVLIVLPATAHSLAQSAQGLSNSLLSLAILAHPHPVTFFPNMHDFMWSNPATQRNVSLLREFGHKVVASKLGTLLIPPPQEVIAIIEEMVAERNREKAATSLDRA